jgi:hypothetical protein
MDLYLYHMCNYSQLMTKKENLNGKAMSEEKFHGI